MKKIITSPGAKEYELSEDCSPPFPAVVEAALAAPLVAVEAGVETTVDEEIALDVLLAL